jgi:RHS repeat-associated protein
MAETSTDGRLTVTTLTYDPYGNPYTTRVGIHPAVTTVYNPIGLMTGLTDQEQRETTFPEYNNRGQLKRKRDPLLKDTVMEYDDAGRLKTITDRKNVKIFFEYTDSDKVDKIKSPDISTVRVSFTYNDHDEMTVMQDELGDTIYEYYADHSLQTVTDPHGFAVGYFYDKAGNLTELTYPGGKKVIYTYDVLNRLDTVTIDWLNPKPVAIYHYDIAGRLDYVDNFNGTITDYTYDNANRLTDLVNKKADQTIISEYHFILDGNGNRKDVTQTEPLLPVINEETSNYTYNPEKNRLMTAGTSGFDYDDEGQLSTKNVHSFTFDYAHRLKTVSGSNNYQYSYDGSGKRLKAIRDSVETRYIYDAAGNLLAEANSSNVIMKYYIHGAGLMAMVTPSDDVFIYHYDAVGNTIAMTDETENIINSYAYTPFGILANENESVIQPFKFVGQHGVMTEPNGFYYMRARYYDTEVGRFISEDPIGFDGGNVNLYAYVGNNPMLLIDPWGMCAEENAFSGSGTIRIPSYSIEALESNSSKFQASVASAGVVTWEVGKMVSADIAEMFITSKIPTTHAGQFATDKSFTLIEATTNVAGDYREIGERVGRRIEWLYER